MLKKKKKKETTHGEPEETDRGTTLSLLVPSSSPVIHVSETILARLALYALDFSHMNDTK